MGKDAGYKGGPQEVDINPDTLPLPTEISNFEESDFNVAGVTALIVDNVRTSVLSQAFVANSFEKLTVAVVSGEVFALWELELNGVVIETRRTSPTLDLKFDFRAAPLDIPVTQTLEMFVTHFTTSDTFLFNTTFYGTV